MGPAMYAVTFWCAHQSTNAYLELASFYQSERSRSAYDGTFLVKMSLPCERSIANRALVLTQVATDRREVAVTEHGGIASHPCNGVKFVSEIRSGGRPRWCSRPRFRKACCRLRKSENPAWATSLAQEKTSRPEFRGRRASLSCCHR